MFHCTAGKDRTGLTAALVLSTLGVDDAQILDDYELSNRYRSAVRLGRDPTRSSPRRASTSSGSSRCSPRPAGPWPRRSPASTSTYGSVEAYLTGTAGVAPATLDALRDHLLEP